MSVENHAEEPKAQKITVDLDPLVDVKRAELAQDHHEVAVQMNRERMEFDDDINGTMVDGTLADSSSTEAQGADEDSLPIPANKIGRAQIEEFKKLLLEGDERKMVIDAMGIDTSRGVTYGPRFAEKVAKFQSEKLGFTWDNPEAAKAGRVPNGLIDGNTLVAMSQLPNSNLDLGKTIERMAANTIDIDKTQEKLYKRMGFTAEQAPAFFELMGAVPGVTTRWAMKLLVQDFQITKLGFVAPDTWAQLPKAERVGKNVADGYFGPKSLAALREKDATALFSKEPAKQQALSVLLGKKVDKAA